MADPVSGNLAMLMQVVDRLAPLLDRFVFLGGVVTELLITSTAAGSPRQTKDVDVVVNVLNLGEYSETLRERFLACGLVEDTRPGAPVCRWCLDDLIVDIMPTRSEILNFSCEWYQVAFDTAQPTMLPNGSTIRLVTPARRDRPHPQPHCRRQRRLTRIPEDLSHAHFRREAEKLAAATLLNRLVMLRLLEAPSPEGAPPMRSPAVVTGGWESRG
jgi:hypothetical protein